jgi:putative alpha-1,2-mannosidase
VSSTILSFKGQITFSTRLPFQLLIVITLEVADVDNFFDGKSARQKDAAIMLRMVPLETYGPMLIRMGLSFISTTQACTNAETEIPDFDFDAVANSSRSQHEEYLNRIRVDPTGVSETHLKLFYSSLYRTLISPQNYTGENPLWDTEEPTFDSFYCIWDTFRFTHPLYNVFLPEVQSQMIRSLLDIYRFDGYLPECRYHPPPHPMLIVGCHFVRVLHKVDRMQIHY